MGVPSASSAARAIAASRSGAPKGLPAAQAAQIYHAAQLSLADGMKAVLFAMAGVMAVAAIVAAAGLRRGIHAAADALQPEAPQPAAPQPNAQASGSED
jgi:hypothetical protein